MNGEPMEPMSGLARAGRFCADFYWPFATDPSRTSEGGEPPPVLVRDAFIGGRQRTGPSMAVLHRPGVAASVVCFGWFTLIPLLAMIGDVWAFVPRKRTEYIRVMLRQRIVGTRLAAPAVVWGATMLLGTAVASAFVAAASQREEPRSGGAAIWAALFVLVGCWGIANWRLLISLRQLGESLFRSSICCDYGFPAKTLLLEASSDGTTEEQFDNVAALLVRASTFPLGSWGRLNVSGSASTGARLLGVPRVANLGSIAKKLLPLASGLGVLCLLAMLATGAFALLRARRRSEGGRAGAAGLLSRMMHRSHTPERLGRLSSTPTPTPTEQEARMIAAENIDTAEPNAGAEVIGAGAGDACEEAISIHAPTTVNGSITGMQSDSGERIELSGYAWLGPDVFYSVYLRAGRPYTFTLDEQGRFDGGLYVFESCSDIPGTTRAGRDTLGTSLTLTFTPAISKRYLLAVDSYGAGSTGNYMLTVR
jgi:hypothetical protein